MGFWNRVIGRNREVIVLDDDLYAANANNSALKRIAVESVIGYIARIIIQSEFRVIKNNEQIRNNLYYKLNVKPNKNQSASAFWNDIIFRLIYDGECLVVKSRTDDLLVAEDYSREEFAVREDEFSGVYVKGMNLEGTFSRSEVMFLEYGNEKLSRLIDSLFSDYGDLISRMFESHKLKGQVRSTVEVDANFLKTEAGQKSLQKFIDRTYNAIKEKAIAIVPQQKGMEYKEHSKEGSTGQSFDEINKATDGFLDKVCNAVGLPPNLLKGDMADIEATTRNGMKFCVDPIITVIKDELNGQLVTEAEYLKGNTINIKRISYRDMFDNAIAIDKLRSSGVADGHELRDEMGLDKSDDPLHDEFVMTKNYETIKGGDNE